jgi:Flp pilus assembly pilin Flp
MLFLGRDCLLRAPPERPVWRVVLKRLYPKFFADHSVAIAIQYALIAAGIGLAIIAAAYLLSLPANGLLQFAN